jgi:hypothetical protein
MTESGTDCEPTGVESMEEEKENRTLGLKVLAVIREAQQKHGLRYPSLWQEYITLDKYGTDVTLPPLRVEVREVLQLFHYVFSDVAFPS